MLSTALLPSDIPLCPNTVAEKCSGFFWSADCAADANGNSAVKKKHMQQVATDNAFVLIRYPSQDVAHDSLVRLLCLLPGTVRRIFLHLAGQFRRLRAQVLLVHHSALVDDKGHHA